MAQVKKYASFVVDWADMKPEDLAEFIWDMFGMSCTKLIFNKDQNFVSITSYMQSFSHIEKKYQVYYYNGRTPPARYIKECIEKRRTKNK